MGVVVEGGSANTVQAINAVDNIAFEGVSGRRGGDGIAILSSRDNRIVNNSAVNNGPYPGIGIYTNVDSAHPPQHHWGLERQRHRRRPRRGEHPGPGSRTTLSTTTTSGSGSRRGTFILNNQVSRNGLDGITLFAGNTFTVVRGNLATGNGFYRVTARRGNGIGLQIGGATTTSRRTTSPPATPTTASRSATTRCGNIVRNNTSIGNAVLPPASATLVPHSTCSTTTPSATPTSGRTPLRNRVPAVRSRHAVDQGDRSEV